MLKYMVRNKKQLNNHPIYSVDTEIDSSIFYNDLSFEEEEPPTIMIVSDEAMRQATKCIDLRNRVENEIWKMSFNGAVSKKGEKADIWVSPPKVGTKLCSYKLTFNCTNNKFEYEALILGLRVLKELGTKRIEVHEDSKMVIN
jgi:hypothetical protein